LHDYNKAVKPRESIFKKPVNQSPGPYKSNYDMHNSLDNRSSNQVSTFNVIETEILDVPDSSHPTPAARDKTKKLVHM
jgi:hypothetical protein